MSDTSLTKTNLQQNEPVMKGWLFKWTNYLKGYQRRWFVLQNGHLSYYRNQAEMAHTCRGSISLHGALIYTVDACTFVISNGGTQTFHIRAASEVERQSWVTALELAKAKAIRNMESEEDDEETVDGSGSPEEWSSCVRKLEAQLNDLQTCSDLINKHWKALVKPLNDIETNTDPDLIQNKLKEIGERATLFRISTNAMINTCAEYLKTSQAHGHKWIRLLQHEREQRQRLQEMVETLAQQHSKLEQAANAHTNRPAGVGVSGGSGVGGGGGGGGSSGGCGAGGVTSDGEDEDDNEFYDALAENNNYNNNNNNNNNNSNNLTTTDGNHFTLNIPTSNNKIRRRNSSDSSSEPDETTETKQVVVVTGKSAVATTTPAIASTSGSSNITTTTTTTPVSAETTLSIETTNKRQRRTRVPDKPHYPLNLWSIMKNCIGKDLSKIPMPVNFSEPLSMLQRLTEDYEYAEILDIAAKCSDPCEQLAYVAAFTVSSYSTTSCRTGKPFNPLLGETYECDRSDDLGWRAINEQVSHHPPMVAQYCEGKLWKCWQEFTMTSKFRGKYLQVIPLGTAQVEFLNSGNKYSWRKVTTTVHNIIVGKLWVDQHGDMEIIGKGVQVKGIKCHLKYIPYSYFSRDSQRRVKGVVMDQNGLVKWVINGTWDNKVEIAPVININNHNNNPIYETGQAIIAWQRRMPPSDAEHYYNFTIFASQLNELEPGVAPTDSRLRPDQRLMEEGKWDEANLEKIRLEEKQRAVRRKRESDAEEAAADGRPYEQYKPLWFEQARDPEDDTIVHVYKGTYWDCKDKQDWSACPDIF